MPGLFYILQALWFGALILVANRQPMGLKGNYAFIDSQNLNLGIKSQGWSLDFRKFRLYLKNKYEVEKAFLSMGRVDANLPLYRRLENMGYELVFKPITKYRADGRTVIKGNVDAELVLHAAARMIGRYKRAVIVSGDGDFYCLVEYLVEKEKLACVLVPNGRFSMLLQKFDDWIVRIDQAKKSLVLAPNKKTRTSGRSKP